jgi:rubrerythrin
MPENLRGLPYTARIVHALSSMDILSILDRSVAIEVGAADIYDTLAVRFRDDPEFQKFWSHMADDEREHAHKLSTWRNLLEYQPESRRPEAEGFEEGLLELKKLVEESKERAQHVKSVDEALTVALTLEASELDVIYTVLLQSSPIARFPDIEETRRRELGRHHEDLIREVRKRSKDEKNLYDAQLIAAEG